MPNTKSSAAKKLSGEKRPSRLLRQEEAASAPREPTHPEPSPDLPISAQTVWREIAPFAWRAGLLTPTDHYAFGILCGTLATERQARAELERDGLTVRTAAGTTKSHPAVRTAEAARIIAVRLLGQFGMTPWARSRVDRTPDPSKCNSWNGWGEFKR